MLLLDYFGFFGWISGKRNKISKSGQFQGPMPRRRDLTQQRKSTPWGWQRGRLGQPSGTLIRSKATPWRRPTLQHISATS